MIERIHNLYRPVKQRKQDFKEVEKHLSAADIQKQMSRCHHCGVPFCHGAGCPLFNQRERNDGAEIREDVLVIQP